MNDAYITIVTGLPRTGTSMLMQVLEAGGVPILTDQIRKKDDDNPRGYYEYEAVKHTKDDAAWVTSALGKAVKVIYQLVYDLPQAYTYRLIYMQRDIREVLSSQARMLERSGKTGASLSQDEMEQVFTHQLLQFEQWLEREENISVLAIQYADILCSPLEQCQRIGQFLGLGDEFNVRRAAQVVDPSLYRNRS